MENQIEFIPSSKNIVDQLFLENNVKTPELKEVCDLFNDFARKIFDRLPDNEERAESIRRLRMSKEMAINSFINQQ